MKPLKLSRFMWLALVITVLSWGVGLPAAIGATVCGQPTCLGFNNAVDYTKPNFANSPNIRKFVDSLPGLGSANANNLGQYIPIANPDTISFPGSDYYEIGLKQYTERLHSDLPVAGTMLRGYYQINSGTAGQTDHNQKYLGPLVIAHRDRPVRVSFQNLLGINGAGDLPLPVDTTIMGAGPGVGGSYTQNRASVHLHGGATPWISDGTPHQWITPFGDTTTLKKGASQTNVPDMVDPSGLVQGTETLYYTNQQSARLMFYHDHAYGLTRLNVYAGEAAGYLLVDQVEEDMISGSNVSGVFTAAGMAPTKVLPDLGGVYHYGIPLIIQDKSFVNAANTPPASGFSGTPTPITAAVDPLWFAAGRSTVNVGGGNLWWPHEYMPNENIYDPSGFNKMGRWDYGPFMIPAATVTNNTLPSPTIIPETFMDTMLVNGTPYPYLNLPPTPVRFRILNASNDRFLNLQLYYAATAAGVICKGANAPAANLCTEVSMVPASPNANFPTWPTDGRPGGVPDPTTAGPSFVQIGTEGGFLVKPAVLPQQPVDFDYNRRSITFGDVLSTTLLLGPAFRADIIMDFSGVPSGSTLILYNDNPAPMPGHDDRNDYYTNSPDQTSVGGAPPTTAGFGPNTRTIMQFRIAGTATAPFNMAPLNSVLPAAFAISEDPPIVKQAAFGPAYGQHYTDVFSNAVQGSLNISGTTQPVSRVLATLPGLGYTTAPTVNFAGGGGTGAVATAGLNGVGAITVLTSGCGYNASPVVTISAPLGITGGVSGTGTGSTQAPVLATATADISGGVVTAINIVEPGSGYTTAQATTAPITVTVAAPTGTPAASCGGVLTAATAQGNITLGTVGNITVNTPGSGYSSAPQVLLTGGGGTGAGADAMLLNDLIMTGKNLTEGFDMDFGRMNVVLGSTPSALSPSVGAGTVLGAAFYIDPPTEILDNDVPVLWRITHLGADSHAMHFHLFNVQVVNRVDYTNTVKPPYPDELGWRDVIRTNPFEDVIVAIRPKQMALPFVIPRSSRLLDVTTVAGSTVNFLPVAPPVGIAAVSQTSNQVTDFGWEYVWHCHLLGHEENDMMRPMVFNPPTIVAPASVLAIPTQSGQIVRLSWTNSGATTSGAAGFNILRCTGAACTPTVSIGSSSLLTYADTSVAANTAYVYGIQTINNAGTSPLSNTRAITTAAAVIPTAPTAISPTGNGNPNSPTFTFSAVPGAVTYSIKITDVTTGVVAPATVITAAQGGCTSGTGNCNFIIAAPLASTSNYSWSVAAINTAGTGPSSATLNFNVTFTPISAHVGVFTNGTWYIDMKGNGVWDGGVVDRFIANFGTGLPNAIPVAGDWDGSGIIRVGVFSNGSWYLDMKGDGVWDGGVVDKQYNFGTGLSNAIPVTGDWTGTGTTKIGVFSNSSWYLDMKGNGVWDGGVVDKHYSFGFPGAIPVTGDWNNSGVTKIGVFFNGTWYFDMNGNGTWDGTAGGDRTFANFGAGLPNATPVAGDWTNTGTTRVGVFSNGTWYLDILGNGIWDGGVVDVTMPNFGAGLPNVMPLVMKKK